MKKLTKQVQNEFSSRFHDDYSLIRSPGRVNLIGEHTDYNDGFVLPAAIDKVIMVAIAPNDNNEINMVAIDKGESHTHDFKTPLTKSEKGWPNYIIGVVDVLQKAGHVLGGFDCIFGGNIPIGAGLSSSAALEGGIITGLVAIYDLNIPMTERALLGQKVENDFVGVNCGIMDQFVNINGKDQHALKLDCRSLDYELYPLKQDDVHIVLCDTRIRRELASSEYNIRRRQCEEGVERLSRYDDSIESLRDLEIDFLEENKNKLEPVIYNRCKYVVEENMRVEDSCNSLNLGDIEAFGGKMFESHAGLRDLYEVSCEELDVLVEETENIDGVLGSRMMGGGFGGCTINLVKEAALESFSEIIQNRYRDKTGKDIEIYRTQIGPGTRVEHR